MEHIVAFTLDELKELFNNTNVRDKIKVKINKALKFAEAVERNKKLNTYQNQN